MVGDLPRIISPEERVNMSLNRDQSLILKLVSGIVVTVFALSVGCASVGTVPSGSVGVVTRFGGTTGELKQPGLFVVVPFVSAIERMDTQTHAHKASGSMFKVTCENDEQPKGIKNA
jgi:regulator of protease activity HflC (stomatin/prohibitin superfamily)